MLHLVGSNIYKYYIAPVVRITQMTFTPQNVNSRFSNSADCHALMRYPPTKIHFLKLKNYQQATLQAPTPPPPHHHHNYNHHNHHLAS